MSHQRIYCTQDPTWHDEHTTDTDPTPSTHPGVLVQWHEGTLGIATGDLAIDDHGEAKPERIDEFLTAPLLPADERGTPSDPVHVLDLLRDELGEPRDSDTADRHSDIITAIRAAVARAYAAGTAVPRMVWLSRANSNEVIRTVRHGRNKSYGADE